jgi:hypothetical protein
LAGGLFSVVSLDLATSLLNVDLPNFLTVSGEFADGSAISTRLQLGDSFQTYFLTGFSDLVSLTINPLEIGPGYFAVDNIVLSGDTPPVGEVPLPATLPLAALGLAALGAVRRLR